MSIWNRMVMASPAELLWRINSEYLKRLQRATTYLNLLEQLVLMQSGNTQRQTLAALRQALEQVETLQEEHRDWRYAYYYESLDTRRMVQSHGAINRALARFSRMRTRHDQQLQSLRAHLVHTQRPDPALTRVPTGDLWTMAEYAIGNLTRFDDYMRSLVQV